MSSRALDGLRGLAALYVVLHHAFGLLWRGAPADDAVSVAAVVQLCFSFGHQAVLVFFLISGFCIHYRQARTGVRRVPFGAFVLRRLKRLYPPLLLAFAATAVLDQVGMRVYPAMYDADGGRWPGQIIVGASYTWQTLAANLLFQARLGAPELGSNSPLWSLAYEFWFYLLYPTLLIGFRRFGAVRTTGLVCVLSWASCLYASRVDYWYLDVLGAWAIWVLGVLLAEAYVGGHRPALVRILGPTAPAALLVFAALSPGGPQDPRFPDLVWGAAFALALADVLLNGEQPLARFLERVCLAVTGLGRMSYSLYLVHYPLLAMIAAGWLASRAALPAGLELIPVATALALGFGWIAWYAVERRWVPADR